MREKTIQTKKNAGYFIRFGALLIDASIFIILSLFLSLACISQEKIDFGNEISFHLYLVTNKVMYYSWLCLLIVTLCIEYLLIPYFLKGRTLGMIITRIELKSNDEESYFKKTFKRWQLTCFFWILIIFLFLVLVRFETVNKLLVVSYIQNNKSEFINIDELKLKLYLKPYKLSTLEIAAITIPSTISGFTVIAQVLLSISVGANAKKIGIVDKITNSQIVYSNKFIKINIKEFTIPEPIKVKKININWKN